MVLYGALCCARALYRLVLCLVQQLYKVVEDVRVEMVALFAGYHLVNFCMFPHDNCTSATLMQNVFF